MIYVIETENDIITAIHSYDSEDEVEDKTNIITIDQLVLITLGQTKKSDIIETG